MNSLKLINDELESNENKKINQRMDMLEGRMDMLEGRMDMLEGRMGRLEERMDRLEGRMDRLEGRMEEKLDEIINIIKGSGLTDAKK